MYISDLEAVESPEDVARHIQKITAAGSDRFETRLLCKDGHTIKVEASVIHMSQSGRMIGFVRDISWSNKAEKELRFSEAHYRQLVQSLPGGLTLVDASERSVCLSSPKRFTLCPPMLI